MSEPRPSRPSFPGYGVPGGADGMLPWSWAEQELTRARNYWLVTSSPERGPHAMPVWGLWRDGGLVFSTGSRSRKARDLAEDPRLVVHLESGDDVVAVEGTVERIRATSEIAEEYERKYGWRVEVGAEGWYRVVPSRAYAFREQEFPRSATRFDF
jgi:pyridoxine/pyridoxamine 5'-phosphate oxidase